MGRGMEVVRKYAILDWSAVAVILTAGLCTRYASFGDNPSILSSASIDGPEHIAVLPDYVLIIILFTVVMAVVAAMSAASKKLSTFKASAAYAFSISTTILVDSVMKKVVCSPRMDTIAKCSGQGSYSDCQAVLDSLQLTDQFSSFPSSTAAESMAASIFISLFLNQIWESSSMIVVLFEMPSFVFSLFLSFTEVTHGFSRIEDVLGGFAIGFCVSFITYRIFRLEFRQKLFSAMPPRI